jgi:hypothetical protein
MTSAPSTAACGVWAKVTRWGSRLGSGSQAVTRRPARARSSANALPASPRPQTATSVETADTPHRTAALYFPALGFVNFFVNKGQRGTVSALAVASGAEAGRKTLALPRGATDREGGS